MTVNLKQIQHLCPEVTNAALVTGQSVLKCTLANQTCLFYTDCAQSLDGFLEFTSVILDHLRATGLIS